MANDGLWPHGRRIGAELSGIADPIAADELGRHEGPATEARRALARPGPAPGAGRELVSHAQGFVVEVPRGMEVDTSLEPVVTVLRDATTRIEIFHETFTETEPGVYARYKASPVRSGGDPVELVSDRSFRQRDCLVHELKWTRRRLREVPDDRTHYTAVDIEIDSHDALSVNVKTSDPAAADSHLATILASCWVFPPAGDPPLPRPSRGEPRRAALAPAAQRFFAERFAAGGQRWGIFEPGTPLDSAPLADLERDLAFSFSALLVYAHLGAPDVGAKLEAAWQLGKTVELTLHAPLERDRQEPSFFYDLLDGRHEAALRCHARSVARFGRPVLFRLNNEMNGDWCRYSAFWTSQDAELYRTAWHYVYRLFEEESALNAIWVWNPNDRSFPAFKYNDPVLYYPGDACVDVIGLTGYNTGTYFPNEAWRTFHEIYDALYRRTAALFPRHPFMITEFACSSYGGDKPAWILDALARLRDYPRIKLAVWWNGCDWDGPRKARPYRLDDPESRRAFREGLAGVSPARP